MSYELEPAFQRLQWLVDGALKLQGFRRVAVELLDEAGEVDLQPGTIPAALAARLAGSKATDWGELGHRLALLRRIDNFGTAYIAVREHRLRLALVFVFRGHPTTDDQLRPRFDYAWDLLKFLEPEVERYRLAPAEQAAITETVRTFVSLSAPPWCHASRFWKAHFSFTRPHPDLTAAWSACIYQA